MEIYLYQKASLVECIDLKGFFCCGYDSCVTHVRRYFYLIGRKTMHHPKIRYCHWIDSPYTLNQGKFLCTDLFPFLWVSILIFLAVLWISRKKSMRLNCDVLCLWFSHMPTVCSLLLVALTAVRRIYHLLCLQQYLWSAQHRSIPSWCACCKSSINFTNKLKCVEERLHTFVWSLLCAIAPLSSSIPHMTSLYFSPPLLSRITHPRASRETLWGSFDWNDTAASGILK